MFGVRCSISNRGGILTYYVANSIISSINDKSRVEADVAYKNETIRHMHAINICKEQQYVAKENFELEKAKIELEKAKIEIEDLAKIRARQQTTHENEREKELSKPEYDPKVQELSKNYTNTTPKVFNLMCFS